MRQDDDHCEQYTYLQIPCNEYKRLLHCVRADGSPCSHSSEPFATYENTSPFYKSPHPPRYWMIDVSMNSPTWVTPIETLSLEDLFVQNRWEINYARFKISVCKSVTNWRLFINWHSFFLRLLITIWLTYEAGQSEAQVLGGRYQ